MRRASLLFASEPAVPTLFVTALGPGFCFPLFSFAVRVRGAPPPDPGLGVGWRAVADRAARLLRDRAAHAFASR